jgi:FMN-dependent NADH-azoreductase
MSLLRIDTSIRADGSHSRAIADIVEREWLAAHDGKTVVRRDLGRHPIPATVWADAVGTARIPANERTPEQAAAVALANEAVDELIAADALLFAAPLYNFGVSQHLKAWIDLIIADPRMGSGAEPILAGKPAVLVIVRGGGYGSGSPREGWDHATAWIRRILDDVWKLDLRVIENELTLAAVNPAMADLIGLADVNRAAAEAEAVRHGQEHLVAVPIG